MRLRATDAAFWALLCGLVVGMAWSPVVAWAQFKAQAAALSITSASGLSGAGTEASPLAFTGTTTAAISTSATAPQYACSLATAACGIQSGINAATCSTTVAAVEVYPAAAANCDASDLLFAVKDAPAGNIVYKVDKEGDVSGKSMTILANSSFVFAAGDSNAYFYRSASNYVQMGDQATPTFASGKLLAGATSGDAISAVAGGYARFTFNAGAPTATDCDAAGESGRIAIDTANNRFYFCNGAAWQYANEDVP